MKQLHASGEDYLEAILVLKRKKGMVRSVDVARHLDVSKPSVSCGLYFERGWVSHYGRRLFLAPDRCGPRGC